MPAFIRRTRMAAPVDNERIGPPRGVGHRLKQGGSSVTSARGFLSSPVSNRSTHRASRWSAPVDDPDDIGHSRDDLVGTTREPTSVVPPRADAIRFQRVVGVRVQSGVNEVRGVELDRAALESQSVLAAVSQAIRYVPRAILNSARRLGAGRPVTQQSERLGERQHRCGSWLRLGTCRPERDPSRLGASIRPRRVQGLVDRFTIDR